MANNDMLVEERSRDIGNFLVGRLLPFRKKRQVGPFTFIDHMGPSTLGPKQYFDVDQHPHIGLSTLTYLLEGEIEHRDSTGAHEIITPGSVNFMSAGRGVAHTERTPAYQRDGKAHRIHGYQVWVALPREMEEMEPTFVHLAADRLPRWTKDGIDLTLVAGEGFGKSSPLPVFSPLFMVDAIADEGGTLSINGELRGEIAIVVVAGSVTADGESIKPGQMLIAKSRDHCALALASGTRVLLFGGEPLPEERFMYWNFVSSSRERIEKAKQDWRKKRFPKVPGDDTYIPLPGKK